MHMSGLWRVARVRRLPTDGLMQRIAALGVGGAWVENQTKTQGEAKDHQPTNKDLLRTPNQTQRETNYMKLHGNTTP